MLKVTLLLTSLLALVLLLIPSKPRVTFPIPSPLLVDQTQQLQAQVARSIELSNSKISAARKTVFLGLITDTAMKTFDSQEERKFWVALIGVESRYESTAKSSTGAIGLGQLIPSYRNDFGKACGITQVDVADLQEDAVNLKLSACFFKQLISENHGNIPLALVQYNQGGASKSYADAKKGGSPNQEAAAYVTRVAIKKARAEGK